jgi:DNA topoisomerase IB
MQYIYHEEWRRRRDEEKFERMLGFARRLADLRRQVRRDLGSRELGRMQILACAVRLLDRGSFRVGTEVYTELNGSFGLSTLRKDHVRVGARSATFSYTAKGGKRREVEIRDDDLLPILRRLRRRRDGGDRLLAYREPEGWRNISSQDINGYLQTVIGDGYTAKDFRTWHATFLAAVTLGRMSKGEGSRARIIASAIREVSEHLGNTPAVCRASYVDPRVTDAFEDGDHLGAELSEVDLETDPDEARRRIELAVIRLIERQVPSERRAA